MPEFFEKTKYLTIPIILFLAAAFVFCWRMWAIRHTLHWLILSIIVTLAVALCMIFAAASLVLYIINS